ncbi:hypothetical protein TVAG_277740 [Trichomonas vaginalis G3]|uniref:DUF3447 domain-containing protein n=1 Tax=Trichomonas vaginalis (strain ATCC PRA-98 / G3) TaxID=412133 RepID=A2FF35_TRIV3|nr:spectrin binding [Trichomonas vaginalis G3]EAX96493.1 hypothetical protein TVAG_277740 [Trichomonas vaginalis G3]KAI5552102.1 spectrin binding [Trichomonas vaginalis G3]|eukprot:XP_001309423.1 hypothetical protein [Trichomonas vaginalis G3]
MTIALFEESLPAEFKILITATDMLWEIEEDQIEQIVDGLIKSVETKLLTDKDIAMMIDYVCSKRCKKSKLYLKTIKDYATRQNFFIPPKCIENSDELKALLLIENQIYGALPDQYIGKYEEEIFQIYKKGSILHALLWDDLEELQQFTFNVDFDFNRRIQGLSLVEHAAKNGSVNCYKYLISNDANISSETLQLAYLGNDFEIIHSAEEKGETEELCLKNAVMSHYYDAAYYLHDKYLFEYKWDWALRSYNFSMFFNKLYESDNVDNKDADGDTAFLCATRLGLRSICEMLIAKGANIEEKDRDGNTPLIIAARDNISEVFDLLIENHANVNAQNNENYSALMYASENDYMSIIEKLFENKASVDLFNIYGCSALMLACRANRLDVVKLLLKKHAYIERRSTEGYTSIMLAVQNNNIQIVKYLIDNRANLEARTNDGFSALMIACEHNYVEIVKLLLENKAAIDATDEYGFNSYILASRYKHTEVIKLLKKYNNKCRIC